MTSLDLSFVERFAETPSDTTVQRAISLHQNIRQLLPDDSYLTFLQGSYRNGTALADINDVDIVVVHRRIKRSFWFRDYDWKELGTVLLRQVEADTRYSGKVTPRDKCISIGTGVNIDLVPAIHSGDPSTDPIWIHSARAQSELKNWPRAHYELCAAKNIRTGGAFKRTVRLFKRWARCHFEGTRIAPSYYIESLLHSLHDNVFEEELPRAFCLAIDAIRREYGSGIWTVLTRVGGEDDLLTSDEWDVRSFGLFSDRLYSVLDDAVASLTEKSPSRAKAAWRRAFNGFDY